MMPFNCDHRRPCPIIDNTEPLPYLYGKYGLEPTHKDAERILTDLRGFICEASEHYRQQLEQLDREETPVAQAR